MSKKRRTNKEVDELVKDRPFKRVGNYMGSDTNIDWKCDSCKEIWSARPTKIINEQTGCPTCSYNDRNAKRRLSNADIDARLVGRPIIRVGEIKKGIKVPIEWSCTDCSYKWNAAPDKILNQYTGCPNCADVGGGRYGRTVLRDGIKFDSQLEADCFSIISRFFKPTEIELQKRYPHNNRMSCDFYIIEKKMWVEVSSLKTKEYLDRIVRKQEAIDMLGESFIFCNSPGKVLQLMEEI